MIDIHATWRFTLGTICRCGAAAVVIVAVTAIIVVVIVIAIIIIIVIIICIVVVVVCGTFRGCNAIRTRDGTSVPSASIA